MLDHPEEYQKMAHVERDHWWYRTLHVMVLGALRGHPRGSEARILDAGCGTGGLLLYLQARGYRNIMGVDVSPHALAWCGNRGLAVETCDVRVLDRVISPESADVIVSNDTLYFFGPQELNGILRLFWERLTWGGRLILNVPALPAFRGTHDLCVGIQHRFTRADVSRLLPGELFRQVRCVFWPFLLAPCVAAVRFAQRRRLHRTGRILHSDVRLPPRWINESCYFLCRAENALLRWRPWGSSLFLVGEKHAAP